MIHKSNFFTIKNIKHKTQKLFCKKKLQKFQHYITFVTMVLQNHDLTEARKKAVVIKLLKILSLNLQNHKIEELLSSKETSNQYPFPLRFQCSSCCFDTGYLLQPLEGPQTFIHLNIAPVVAPLWNSTRMINAFASIGQSLKNPFRYDERNHFSNIYIYPIGLVMVTNGLHSVTTGIYDSEGMIALTQYIDITSFYDDILFDGIAFIHQKCGRVLNVPSYEDIGILFEIGRLLKNYHLPITPDDLSII